MEQGNPVEMARALASYAHAGQKDRAGNPFIEHPITVAQRVNTPEEKTVAYLHDVVEDTFVTLGTIRNLFGNQIGDAVDAMTHRADESYEQYIVRLGSNPIARIVKLADLSHNMDMSRLPEITPKDLERQEKYRRAKKYLEEL